MSQEATQEARPETKAEELWLDEMTPRQIVAELDKYIVGQEAAKKSVAIALRNRWRRQRVDEDLREEIVPNNIIMIGPTGVGKTEIARRLARLAGAPFVKVEASKFTEVGYVGRDVESMVRDLVDVAINMVRTEREDEVQEQAEQKVEERLLDLLIPPVGDGAGKPSASAAATLEERLRAFVVSPTGQVEDLRPHDGEKPAPAAENGEDQEARERRERTREKFRQLLREEKLEDREVEVEVQQSFAMENMMVPMGGAEGMDNFTEMLQDFLPKRTKRRRVTIAEARRILLQDELDKLVNMDEVVDEAL
ncbi:MAG TPA: AAA family ATPase, partial [Longimicrobiaceae bacterium]|nr:AAA family ATPase [Longimicrobiaceae bacterium]